MAKYAFIDSTEVAEPRPLRDQEHVPLARGVALGVLRLAHPTCLGRGTQYTSAQLRNYLAEHRMRPSMGHTGICWDNAMAESFFAALKNELAYRTAFPTVSHVKKAVAFYIEVFYNRQRLHSGLGYRTPHEVHIGYESTRPAA